jgi:hypothetical protein
LGTSRIFKDSSSRAFSFSRRSTSSAAIFFISGSSSEQFEAVIQFPVHPFELPEGVTTGEISACSRIYF